MNIIEKIFGTHSENELKRIYPIVDKIEALGPEMEALSDEELRGKTREFKERLKEGETLDDILPEAFAVVREGAYRSIGMRHYRVQMIGVPFIWRSSWKNLITLNFRFWATNTET